MFEIKQEEMDGVPVLFLKGYLDKHGGESLTAALRSLWETGRIRIVLDFSQCKAVSSPGVVDLMESVVTITESFQGRVAIVNIDDLKISLFKMVGVLPVAEHVQNLSEAIRSLKTPSTG